MAKLPEQNKVPATHASETDPMINMGHVIQNHKPPPDLTKTDEDLVLPDEVTAPAIAGPAPSQTGRAPGMPQKPKDAWADFAESDDSWLNVSQSTVGPLPPTPAPFSPPAAPPARPEAADVPPRPVAAPEPAAPPLRAVPADTPAPPAVPLASTGNGASPWASLLTLSGPRAGSWTHLYEKEVFIGRAVDNTIVLADASMSRQHASLLQLPDGSFKVIDKNSGNGTFVGGRRITQQTLKFGDELSFGNETFRFVAAAAASPGVVARRAPPSWASGLLRTYGPPVALGLLLSIAGAASATGLRLYRVRNQTSMRQAAFTRFLTGVEQLGAHKLALSEASLMAALTADPANDQARAYLEALKREQEAQQALAQAHQMQERANWAAAYKAAQGILDSTFRPEAQQIMRSIDGDLETAVVRAHEAIDANQLVQAGERLKLIQSIHPSRMDVAEMQVLLSLKRVLRMTPATVVSRAAAHDRATLGGPAADAQKAFMSGRLEYALHLVESVNTEEGASLRAKLQKFKGALDRADAAHHAKQAPQALAALAEAKTLEQSLASDGSSIFAADISRKMADMHFVSGKHLLDSDRLADAYASYRAGLLADPTHTLCSEALTEIAKRAQILFDEATHTADRGMAAQKLRLVLQIVPPASETYGLASKHLDKL